MKKVLMLLVVLLVASSSLYAMDIGLRYDRDMNAAAGTNPDSYGLLFRYFGDHYLGLELSATVPSTKDPTGGMFADFTYLMSHLGEVQTVNIAPYVLFDYKSDPAVLYAGIAPRITVSTPWPKFDFHSFTDYRVKAGIELDFLFLGAYAEAATNLSFQPSFSMFQAYQVSLGAVLRF